ncbi:MAG: Smr/MutS family protein [Spirochaetaceae bacterium]|jgi:DNA-nicking Smr family endonuclease|nr:Smr/MutS family protein [Spirochaetaceae bacterium]
MNFGEILDKWEAGTGRGGKGSRFSAQSTAPTALEQWLKTNEVIDKDAEAGPHTKPQQKKMAVAERQSRLLGMKAQAEIDLHGLKAAEAERALNAFFDNSLRRGLEKIRIIHGKGNHSKGESVLAELVKTFLEQNPHAGRSGHEKAADGGSGATWVILK